MDRLLNRRMGNELQAVLYDIHLSILNQLADSDRVSGLPVLTEAIGNIRTKIFFNIIGNCIRELNSRGEISNIDISTSVKKLEAICLYCNVSEVTFSHIRESLRFSHNDIHFYEKIPYDRTKDQYKYIVKSAASLIYFTSGIKVLDKIRRIYDEPNNFYHTQHGYERKVGKKETSERQRDLHITPAPRLPIMLLLDASISMSKEDRIEDLNKGIGWLNSALLNDTITKDVIELSIITFNNEVQQVLPFGRLIKQQQFIKGLKLEARGTQKKLGAAINLALQRIDEVKLEYKDEGVDYHQPWIIIVTDCESQNLDNYKKMTEELVNREIRKILNIIPVIVGSGDITLIQKLTSKSKAIRMSNQTFPAFFEWIYENAVFFAKSIDDKPIFTNISWGLIE